MAVHAGDVDTDVGVDQLRGECLKGPPKYPYPRFGLIQPSYFDVDNFAYLDDPKNTELDFFDPLKRIRIGNNWQFTTGGEVRTRYENAYNDRLGPDDQVLFFFSMHSTRLDRIPFITTGNTKSNTYSFISVMEEFSLIKIKLKT